MRDRSDYRTIRNFTREWYEEKGFGVRVRNESLDWQPDRRFTWGASDARRRSWVLARRRRAWIRRQLRETLPLRERLSIELVYLNGMSKRECADVLGVHPSTVQRAMTRGIRRLRRRARKTRALWEEGGGHADGPA